MSKLLDKIRFSYEAKLLSGLFEQFELEGHLEQLMLSGETGQAYDYVMSSQLELTPILAPRLCGLMDEVLQQLGMEEPVSLFVASEASINAFALHSMAPGVPHVISLTSALVERMTDAELRFVFGHELGHLYFQHYRASAVERGIGLNQQGDSRMPRLLTVRMDSWSRLAELSADRAGFVAADSELDTCVSTFFKLMSGLGPEHLNFDIQAFLDQLQELQGMRRRDVLATFSHPVTPIRVRALQLFGESGGAKASKKSLKKIDATLRELTRLLDFEVTEDRDVMARDFLISAGLLAAHADGEAMHDEQWNLLLELVLPMSANPEAQIERMGSAEEALAKLEETTLWLREHAGGECYDLYGQLAHICAVDGRLQGNERGFMLDIAQRLEIPENAANKILYDVLGGYLQSRVASGFRPQHLP